MDSNPNRVTRSFFLNVFMIGEVYLAQYLATDNIYYLEEAYNWMNESFLLAKKLTVMNDGDKMGNVILQPKIKLFNF